MCPLLIWMLASLRKKGWKITIASCREEFLIDPKITVLNPETISWGLFASPLTSLLRWGAKSGSILPSCPRLPLQIWLSWSRLLRNQKVFRFPIESAFFLWWAWIWGSEEKVFLFIFFWFLEEVPEPHLLPSLLFLLWRLTWQPLGTQRCLFAFPAIATAVQDLSSILTISA